MVNLRRIVRRLLCLNRCVSLAGLLSGMRFAVRIRLLVIMVAIRLRTLNLWLLRRVSLLGRRLCLRLTRACIRRLLFLVYYRRVRLRLW